MVLQKRIGFLLPPNTTRDETQTPMVLLCCPDCPDCMSGSVLPAGREKIKGLVHAEMPGSFKSKTTQGSSELLGGNFVDLICRVVHFGGEMLWIISLPEIEAEPSLTAVTVQQSSLVLEREEKKSRKRLFWHS